MLTLGRCRDVKEPRLPSSALFFCALFVITFTSVTFNSCLCSDVFFSKLHFISFCSSSPGYPVVTSKSTRPKWIYSLLASWLIVSIIIFLGRGSRRCGVKPCFHSLETPVIFSCFSGCLLSTLIYMYTYVHIHLFIKYFFNAYSVSIYIFDHSR